MYANLLVDDRIYSQRNYFVIYNIGTPLIDYITYINYITYLHRSSSRERKRDLYLYLYLYLYLSGSVYYVLRDKNTK